MTQPEQVPPPQVDLSEPPSDEEAEALKAKYPGLRFEAIRTCGYWLTFRSPRRPEWMRFKEEGAKDFSAAQEKLIITLIVRPSRERMAEIIEEFPGITKQLGDFCGELAGYQTENERKKF